MPNSHVQLAKGWEFLIRVTRVHLQLPSQSVTVRCMLLQRVTRHYINYLPLTDRIFNYFPLFPLHMRPLHVLALPTYSPTTLFPLVPSYETLIQGYGDKGGQVA